MSGGYWNYSDRSLASDIFSYYLDTDCGLCSEEHDKALKNAIRMNPMEDPEISGILYDIFCLLHSYDWAKSGDTDMDSYRKDVAAFKSRWFNKDRSVQIKETVDICIENLREDLYQAFLPEDTNNKAEEKN